MNTIYIKYEHPMSLPSTIKEFLRAAKVLTYCTASQQKPHCAICYFYFIEYEYHNFLLFKSSKETQHVKEGLDHSEVAGSILPNRKIDLSSNQGIQFNGVFVKDAHKRKSLQSFYYKKYPFAKPLSGEVWAIQLCHLKMTDHTLGFGKKIKWSSNKNN